MVLLGRYRFDVKDLIPYIVAQVVGATAAAFVLYIIAQYQAGFSGVGGFATNGFGDLSPNKFGLGSAFIIEVVLTAFFLIIILEQLTAVRLLASLLSRLV